MRSEAEPIQNIMKEAVVAWWPNGPASHGQWLKIRSDGSLQYQSLDGSGSWKVPAPELKSFLAIATKNHFCSIKSHPETQDPEDSWATVMIRQNGKTCSVTQLWHQRQRSAQLGAMSAAFTELLRGAPVPCCSDFWF
jgi:hypothetical protein